MPLKLSPYMADKRDEIVADAMECKPLYPVNSCTESVVSLFWDGRTIKVHRAWFVSYEEAERYYLAERRRLRCLPAEIWWNRTLEWESEVVYDGFTSL